MAVSSDSRVEGFIYTIAYLQDNNCEEQLFYRKDQGYTWGQEDYIFKSLLFGGEAEGMVDSQVYVSPGILV